MIGFYHILNPLVHLLSLVLELYVSCGLSCDVGVKPLLSYGLWPEHGVLKTQITTLVIQASPVHS